MLDGDRPPSARTKLATRFHEEIGEATAFEKPGDMIDGPALRDAGEIDFKGGVFLP